MPQNTYEIELDTAFFKKGYLMTLASPSEDFLNRFDFAATKILDCFDNDSNLRNKMFEQLTRLDKRLHIFNEMSQYEIDKMRRDDQIKDFDYKKSRAYKELSKRYPYDKLKTKELVGVAQVIEKNLGIPLNREEKRRKNHLYHWFDKHLDVILKFIDEGCIKLVFPEEENDKT